MEKFPLETGMLWLIDDKGQTPDLPPAAGNQGLAIERQMRTARTGCCRTLARASVHQLCGRYTENALRLGTKRRCKTA
jgi:hypothetical protein